MALLRNFATVGAATMASRVLGFARDVMLAAFVGAGPVADAFVVAFRLPNLFRRLFAEGAFNAAFVPLFAGSLETKGRDGARQFALEILAGLFWTLVILTILAQIAMPWLVYALAPGFYEDSAKFDLTILLSRIAFPYLFCMSLIAFLGGILNTFGKFTVAALAPVLLNIIMISALAIIGFGGYGSSRTSGIILAVGVAIAGFVQLGSLMWALSKEVFPLSLQRPRYTDSVRRLLGLGIPGVIAGGITQINIMIGTIIASSQASAVSYLYYADRVYQLPLGVVGIAIGVVLLPDLSRKLRAGDKQAVFDSQNRSLEFSMALTLPAAIALFLIAEEIVHVLFERGAFDKTDTIATAQALTAFAVGLPAFVLIKVFSPAFFAREDTKTPMWFAGISMVINVAGSLILFPTFQHVGIAIASSAAGWVNALLLAGTLMKQNELQIDSLLLKRIFLLCVASAAMGAGVYFGAQVLSSYLYNDALFIRFASLGILVGLGVGLFVVLCQVTGAADFLSPVKKVLRRK